MSNVRRIYIYLVNAISLNAVVWAFVALLRNLLISDLQPQTSALAFQIAVIIIGLPVFLGHWLWGERLARQTIVERGSPLRRLYLYIMMASFLVPLAVNAYNFIGTILGARFISQWWLSSSISDSQTIFYHLLAIIVVSVMWLFHYWVLRDDANAVPISGLSAAIRRVYILLFSLMGLAMTTMAVVQISRWLMLALTADNVTTRILDVSLANEATRLIIGLPFWLIFWYWAQRLFEGPQREEQTSVLRKGYLYGVVSLGALGVVSSGTAILAGLFRRLLSLPTEGDIRIPISIIIGGCILWAYHSFVIRDDLNRIDEGPGQVAVRRLYRYLIAGIGLTALLIGLGGIVSVIIQSLDDGFGNALREQLAWFSAAVLVGLIVWIIPWRPEQQGAVEVTPAGQHARRSIVRRIYIYFFLFVTTMTVLGSAVFVLASILTWLLGSDAPTFTELGHAIAFSLIAAVVWLYHSYLLRQDSRLQNLEKVKSLQDLQMAIVDLPQQNIGHLIVKALKEEIPELDLEPITLTAQVDSTQEEQAQIREKLTQASVIVGPWELAVANGSAGPVTPTISKLVADSGAQKLLIPTATDRWHWVGLDTDTASIVNQAVQAIKQIAAGEGVKPKEAGETGRTVAIAIGVALLLLFVVCPLLSIFVF